MKSESFPHYWICDACAKARGGVWPSGHAATVSLMTCEYCEGKNHKSDEFIAPWVDYDWPDPATTKRARKGRD